MKHVALSLFSIALLLVTPSCAVPTRPGIGSDLPKDQRDQLERIQGSLVQGALGFVKTQDLTVRGKKFTMDCTGTVLAAYWYAGIDLAQDFGKYTGNGVERIYRTMEDNGLLYKVTDPVPGDIIFWDNTYDRNGDGKYNDFFTHTGLVVSMTPSGDIGYVHHNYAKGIVVEYMNLHQPAVYSRGSGSSAAVVNSFMRMKKDVWDDSHTTSGQLFRIFGKGYYLGLE